MNLNLRLQNAKTFANRQKATWAFVVIINYLYKHISYIKSNYNQSKLTYTRKNYIEKLKNKDLTKEEKKEVGGLLGELDEYELKELFDEVLTSIDYNMMVTVKEIDFIIEKLSDIVSSSLNKSLHKNFLG